MHSGSKNSRRPLNFCFIFLFCHFIFIRGRPWSMAVAGLVWGWACSAPWSRWVLCLLTQIALRTLSAFRASVSFLANHDIYSSLGLGPCLEPESHLSAWLLLPKALIGFHPRQEDLYGIPSPADLLREGPITDLKFDSFGPLIWLATLPTSWQEWGPGGSLPQEPGNLREHVNHLLRSHFSFSYLSPALPSYHHLHLYL